MLNVYAVYDLKYINDKHSILIFKKIDYSDSNINDCPEETLRLKVGSIKDGEEFDENKLPEDMRKLLYLNFSLLDITNTQILTKENTFRLLKKLSEELLKDNSEFANIIKENIKNDVTFYSKEYEEFISFLSVCDIYDLKLNVFCSNISIYNLHDILYSYTKEMNFDFCGFSKKEGHTFIDVLADISQIKDKTCLLIDSNLIDENNIEVIKSIMAGKIINLKIDDIEYSVDSKLIDVVICGSEKLNVDLEDHTNYKFNFKTFTKEDYFITIKTLILKNIIKILDKEGNIVFSNFVIQNEVIEMLALICVSKKVDAKNFYDILNKFGAAIFEIYNLSNCRNNNGIIYINRMNIDGESMILEAKEKVLERGNYVSS